MSVCVSCMKLSVLGGHGVQMTRRTGQPVTVGVHGCVRVTGITVGVSEGTSWLGPAPSTPGHTRLSWPGPRPRVRRSGLRPARMGPQLC